MNKNKKPSKKKEVKVEEPSKEESGT